MYTYIHAWYLPIFRIFWAWFLCWMMVSVIYHTWILWEWYFVAMTTLQMRYIYIYIYMVFVAITHCFLELFVGAPKFAPKKSGGEGILALNPPKWAEIETSKFTFHPPNRFFCLHVSRRLKVTPQTLQFVNFYDGGICSQQKIANRESVRCFGNGCFGVSRNVWIFWMFLLCFFFCRTNLKPVL